MTIALQYKIKLPRTSLAWLSQRVSVAIRVKMIIGPHTDTVRRAPGTPSEASSQRPAACNLIPSGRSFMLRDVRDANQYTYVGRSAAV
jgi:hypothetical protein